MAATTTYRTVNVITIGDPLEPLKSFSHVLHVRLFNASINEVVNIQITESTNLSVLHAEFGELTVEEGDALNVELTFGPFEIEGDDSQDYDVWVNQTEEDVMPHDYDEASVEVNWHVAAQT